MAAQCVAPRAGGRAARSGSSLLLAAICPVLLLVVVFSFWSERSSTEEVTAFVGNQGSAGRTDTSVVARSAALKDRRLYGGITKKMYLERLQHRRWAAQFPSPRLFGYVEKWNDVAGEGLIMDQEKQQTYLVIRDEITRSYHKHASLQGGEFVEFFATDEMDEVSGFPLARNVSGPFGRYVKGCEEYRTRMLRHGSFPKRFQDEEKDYPTRRGEWYLKSNGAKRFKK
mmetsp:Transcript_55029/g.118905  ORF Transcript_55029/g.118905 Transcript_55029/m.118905 type:complete len:227 (-) Transcript_55029:121-801(-)